jgi:hypothetical protein
MAAVSELWKRVLHLPALLDLKVDKDFSAYQFALVCPACGTIHRWTKSKAWLETAENPN